MTQLIDLSITQIVAVYNSVSPRSVKTFRDKQTACKRTEDKLTESGKTFWIDNGEVVIGSPKDKPKEPAKPRTVFTDDVLIKINTPIHKNEDGSTSDPINPKRKGSKSAARFALYKDGMTVGEYKAACVKLDGKNAKPAHVYLADIHWDINRGFILVLDAEE